MRYTLGINCSGFHSSACLLGDGVLLSAICEERLSRVKRDKAFPHLAISYCCEAAGIEFGQISDAFMGWHPRHYLRKSDHMLGEALRARGKLSHVAVNELAAHAAHDLSDVEHRLRTANSDLTVHFVDHHQAHLAHVLYGSGYPAADFMILDGFGEITTGMCGHAGPEGVEPFLHYPTPHSMGSFYSAFTDYMGFQPDGDEWKVMALSALGDAQVYYDRIRPLVKVDGLHFELDLSFFEHYIYFKSGYFSKKLVNLLGPPLAPGAMPGKRECDIVAAVQRVAEETLFSLLNTLHARTGSDALVAGGGFFMNSVLNGKLQESTPYKQVFVGGSPDDSGISIGSALYGANKVLNLPSATKAMRHNYFGRAYSNDDIRAELTRRKIRHAQLDDAPAAGARLLQEGRILGWFQGGSEFGQRALGNRSILADPTRAEMKDAVNASVKYREGFRPFAPAILSERQQEVLDVPEDATAYFMEKVFRIRPEWQPRVPAVTHFDGSGRPQTVLRETNPRFHGLITEFDRLTGVPLVLNTSFNINGMPLVETPGDAISCFFACGLDALILGDFLVEK